MPDRLIDLCLTAGSCIAPDLVAFGSLWVVYRLSGGRGVAWVLGKSEDEVRRMGRPRVPTGGPAA